ncbi:MAG: hypothetical protein HC827_02845 [Cyanobacteria bacterium RM1_2_2]|nr:hypothetical protein [Cyanobacteria bacterium RM1_2_2]
MSTSDCHPESPKTAQQVEQQFSQAWHSAAAMPESAKLQELWQLVEPYLARFSDADQLRLVAAVIDRLAELYTLKADRLLADWQEQSNDEGPIIDADFLHDLVQKTMYLDLSDLVKTKPKYQRTTANQSVVGGVEKKKVLQMLDSIESEDVTKQQALQVAHDENISAWIEIVSRWMQDQPDPSFPLIELVQSVNLPLIKVWLALLLGNYAIENRGESERDFYTTEQIWVYAKSNR